MWADSFEDIKLEGYTPLGPCPKQVKGAPRHGHLESMLQPQPSYAGLPSHPFEETGPQSGPMAT